LDWASPLHSSHSCSQLLVTPIACFQKPLSLGTLCRGNLRRFRRRRHPLL
jgi:hypothetical protein